MAPLDFEGGLRNELRRPHGVLPSVLDRLAHQILSQVIDRLIELDDIEPELEVEVALEPLPSVVEIDGVTPHRHYYYDDDDCCEGMRW
jgi:hypothetical protein